MKKLSMFCIVLLCFSIIFIGCQSADNKSSENGKEEKTLDLYLVGATQGGGGVWDLIGAGLGEAIKQKTPSRITFVPGEGVSNIVTLAKGEAELGLSHSSVAAAAIRGIEPFDEIIENVATITSLYPATMQFVVLNNVPFNTIEEMKAQKYPVKIAVGDPGSTIELASRRMLEEYGITYEDIEAWGGRVYLKGMGEAANMMSDGLIEVFCSTGTVPMGAIREISANKEVKILPVDKEVVNRLEDKYGYAQAIVPNGVYNFVKSDILSFSSKVILAVPGNMPEEEAYRITKALVENLDYIKSIHANLQELTYEEMASGTGAPLHPGAAKYYKEIGAVK